MLKLVEVGVGIGIINKLVEEVECIPYRHFLFIEFQVISFFLQYKIICLIGMIEPVKLTNSVPGRIFIIPELLFCFSRNAWIGVTFEHCIFPFVEARKGIHFLGSKLLL